MVANQGPSQIDGLKAFLNDEGAPCEKLLSELVRGKLDKGGGGLTLKQAAQLTKTCRAKLGLTRQSDAELYLAVAAHDKAGRNSLDAPALEAFFRELLPELLDAAAKEQGAPGLPEWAGSSPTQAQEAAVLEPPPSPEKVLRLRLCTLTGATAEVALDSDASVEDLKAAALRSFSWDARAESIPHVTLATAGKTLREGTSLKEHCLVSGDKVDVVRATPPPQQLRICCEGPSCGPSIRGSCGTFVLAKQMRNGRPMYTRDASLSTWNTAIKYHGEGARFLVYEDHPTQGGRWALVDDGDWPDYEDRSYAFIVSDAPHPGFLEGKTWHCFRNRRLSQEPAWVKHESLHLEVE